MNQMITRAKWILFVPLVMLCGCVSQQLNDDFTNYPKAYSKASDKLLLLNLARLSRDQPVSFMQLSTINSQYQYTTSGSTGTPSAGWAVRHAIFPFYGQVNLGRVATPTFSFVPVSGSNYVQAVLTPLQPNVYLTFYDQGYPVDLIVRLMASSVQHIISITPVTNTVSYTNYLGLCITNADGSITVDQTKNMVVSNVISLSCVTNYENLMNNPYDSTYPEFLKFCNNLRNAQLAHELSVVKVGGKGSRIFYSTNATLADVITANQASGISLSADDSGRVTAMASQQSLQLVKNPDPYVWEGVPSSTLFASNVGSLDVLKPITKAFVAEYTNGVYSIKMRTFEGDMHSVAKQQIYFAQCLNQQKKKGSPYYQNKGEYGHDEYGYYLRVYYDIGNPNYYFTVRPLMRLTYDDGPGNDTSSPSLTQARPPYLPPGFDQDVSLDYDGTIYRIGNAGGSRDGTVFTLLTYLYAQTAISTQSLPVQQLIQVP